MTTLRLEMNGNLFLRDPQDTELGRKIIEQSIRMIDELGFEKFTFKKLAAEIDSTEPSVYRYFENKHRLLVYLIAWYWNWLEYRIQFGIQNIEDAQKKLEIAIRIVAEAKQPDPLFPNIDEVALFRIVTSESYKTYLTKQVDEDNSVGLFRGFKSLCQSIASLVQELNPAFEYPNALISTMLEAAHQQVFFAKHLPSLTELSDENENLHENNIAFLTRFVLNTATA